MLDANIRVDGRNNGNFLARVIIKRHIDSFPENRDLHDTNVPKFEGGAPVLHCL